MKNVLKLGAVVLAIVMVLSMSVTAFAAQNPESMTNENGVIGEFNRNGSPAGSPVVKADSVTIYKELTVFNPSAASVQAPTISYSYAIASEDGGDTITDASGVEVVTYAGVIDTNNNLPSITSTVSWGPSESVDAASSGAANRKPITINFEGIDFPRAGVYRYCITESIDDAAYTAAGVNNGTTSNVRYLDVYVKDDGIYGYVLLDSNGNVTNETAKTEGFVATTGTEAQTADQYHTFNLTISKTVANDAYIQTMAAANQFPFTVTFTNSTVTGAVQPIISTSGAATLTQGAAAAISSFTSTNPTIGHNGSVTYTGIPMGTAVAIVETNNVTGTTYAVSTTGADTNITTAEAVTSGNNTTGTIAINAQTAGSEADKTVAVTNDMQIISPTGVVLRVAPFALMLGVGIFLLLVSKKRRHPEEA